MPKNQNELITKNFTVKEIECKCGCGQKNIDILMMYKLQQAREVYDNPIRITSGVRCFAWNKKVGGVENSPHIKGQAIDMFVASSNKRFLLVKALMISGFKRIGIAFNFVHVDIDQTRTNNVLFLYTKQPDTVHK